MIKKSAQKKNSFILLLSSFLILSITALIISQNKIGFYLGKFVAVPPQIQSNNVAVLAEYIGSDNKHIYVDLSKQTLYAYEDNRLIYTFLISSGKWGRTPTGDFKIWYKAKYTKMSGGSAALHTYYYLPNVPYVMFFANDQIAQSRGFSLHGTYWHDNFGHPMSHGCINMRTADAETLYYWTNPKVAKNATYTSEEDPGTPITIYGEAPKE